MTPFEAVAISAEPTLTGVAAIIMALRTSRKVDDVHTEVKTLNGKTIAELIEAVENRRLDRQNKTRTTEAE